MADSGGSLNLGKKSPRGNMSSEVQENSESLADLARGFTLRLKEVIFANLEPW
jgi:hypothetical protein